MNIQPFFLALAMLLAWGQLRAAEPPLQLQREDHWLILRGPVLGTKSIRINYLEAYCRANSSDADWVKHTVIKHKSVVTERNAEGTMLKLQDTLDDGVTVEHTITAHGDEVRFALTAKNPTKRDSEAHWFQPCVRLAEFTGFGKDSGGDLDDFLPKCFLYLDGKLTRMPTKPWAMKARYTPGQVWCPKHVPRSDVNPRPLSKDVPSCGLIGCFSADEKMLFATAWEPYQELFQGVARCLHVDPRLGGLKAGETREIRGRIYLLPNDPEQLWKRYQKDFPEHMPKGK
jgi:hypothetical protein